MIDIAGQVVIAEQHVGRLAGAIGRDQRLQRGAIAEDARRNAVGGLERDGHDLLPSASVPAASWLACAAWARRGREREKRGKGKRPSCSSHLHDRPHDPAFAPVRPVAKRAAIDVACGDI
jgi:hypothetical protein